MIGALHVAKTGLTAQETQLSVISNNLANVGTVGFKKDRTVFEDLLYQVKKQPGALSAENAELPTGFQVGTGVRVVGTEKLFVEGSRQVTDNPLDMAISGRGFFQLINPAGDTVYTRDGQFNRDSQGQIVNSQGFLLDPQITIPEDAETVTIGLDGTVTVFVAGDTAPTEIGTVQIATFVNPAGLQPIGSNHYRETAASGAPVVGNPGDTGIGTLVQGVLENSNVNSVEELVSMISTQRAFEMNSKVISTADQMLSFVTNQL